MKILFLINSEALKYFAFCLYLCQLLINIVLCMAAFLKIKKYMEVRQSPTKKKTNSCIVGRFFRVFLFNHLLILLPNFIWPEFYKWPFLLFIGKVAAWDDTNSIFQSKNSMLEPSYFGSKAKMRKRSNS